MAVITFTVLGDPQPQPRPRAFARKVFDRHLGQEIHRAKVYTPGSAEEWKSLIAAAAKPHLPSDPINAPIECELAFVLDRPARLMRRRDPEGRMPSVGPRNDCDNLAKAALDALTQIRMWADDGLVWRLVVTKEWTEKGGGRPGLEARIIWDDELEQPSLVPRAKPTQQPEDRPF